MCVLNSKLLFSPINILHKSVTADASSQRDKLGGHKLQDKHTNRKHGVAISPLPCNAKRAAHERGMQASRHTSQSVRKKETRRTNPTDLLCQVRIKNGKERDETLSNGGMNTYPGKQKTSSGTKQGKSKCKALRTTESQQQSRCHQPANHRWGHSTRMLGFE